jgi:hypothetical protein
VPTQARRIVVANPGTYVLASLEVAAPYGLGKVYAGADGEAQLRRYLEQPLTIYLGEDDIKEDDRNEDADAIAQGVSRFERGTNTFSRAKALAQARGWPFNWRLVDLPGVGHDAGKMFSAPQASEALAPRTADRPSALCRSTLAVGGAQDMALRRQHHVVEVLREHRCREEGNRP